MSMGLETLTSVFSLCYCGSASFLVACTLPQSAKEGVEHAHEFRALLLLKHYLAPPLQAFLWLPVLWLRLCPLVHRGKEKHTVL